MNFFLITSGLEEEDGMISSTGPDQTAQSDMSLHYLYISCSPYLEYLRYITVLLFDISVALVKISNVSDKV